MKNSNRLSVEISHKNRNTTWGVIKTLIAWIISIAFITVIYLSNMEKINRNALWFYNQFRTSNHYIDYDIFTSDYVIYYDENGERNVVSKKVYLEQNPGFLGEVYGQN